VIAEPPLLAGAAHDTTACVFPELPVTPCGGPGGPFGVTGVEAVDGAPVPAEFVAFTENVYAVPSVSPPTLQVSRLVVHVLLSGADVTVYPVTAAPPLLAGAAQVTAALPGLPFVAAVAATDVGAPGTVAGITPTDEVDTLLVPSAFVAVTANVYDVPLVSAATLQVSAPVVPHVFEPGVDVTVYAVIAEPPSLAGATHTTDTDVLPGVPTTPVGVPGMVAGVIGVDRLEAPLVPTTLLAVAVNV